MLTVAAAWLRTRLALLLLAGLAGSLALLLVPGRASADLVREDQLWVLDAVHAQQAWPVSQGQGVKVAVIDSGVNPEVSDLTGSVSSGPDLTGVGTPSSSPDWGMHGTWMASLIAGHGDLGGGSGILGVAPKAHVLSIRVITDQQDPGYQRYQRESQQRVQGELARAITYAVAHHADVISMSLGYGRPSLAVRRALQDAFTHRVVVVASSGNSGASAAAHGKNAPYSFPADYPGVLGVAAVNRNGQPAGFSSDNLSVQVAAPGVKVPAQGADGKYWLVSGTSPACALTAGVAALIKSKYPHLAPELIRQAITSSTSNPPSGGYNAQVGFGTVDAPAALTAARNLAGRGASPRYSQKTQATTGYFGGGPAAIPAAPVHARSTGMLVVYSLLGALCLALIIWATSRLATMRRQPVPISAGLGPDDPAAIGGTTGDPGPWAAQGSLSGQDLPADHDPWAAQDPRAGQGSPPGQGSRASQDPRAGQDFRAGGDPRIGQNGQAGREASPGDAAQGERTTANSYRWADPPGQAAHGWPDPAAEDGRGWADPAAEDGRGRADPATEDGRGWANPAAQANNGWTQKPAQPRPGGWSDPDAQDTQTFPAAVAPEPAPAPDDTPDLPHRSLWDPGPAGRHAGAPHRHGVSRPAE